MGEKQNRPFQLLLSAFLKVDFQGSRVTSEGGLILVRELAALASRVWLVSLGPKAKLQQVMMTVAQKAPFELVAVDGPASGFTDSFETAATLADAIRGIAGLDTSRLLQIG